MQDLNPLELSCDADRDSDCQTNGNLTTDSDKLNPEATHLQHKRKATATAALQIIDVIQEEN